MYGPTSETLVGSYMDNKSNPVWDERTVTSIIYVENCSLAHFAYERTLLSYGPTEKGFGGRSYCITDGGPAPSYGDMFKMIEMATNGQVTFSKLSPTFLMLLSHAFERIYLAKRLLPAPLSSLVPDLPVSVQPLQPPVFSLTLPHTFFDDSRARKEIGYRTPWTSIHGVWETVRSKQLGDEGKGVKVMWKGVGGGTPVGEAHKAAAVVADKLKL